jgi:hypothetical protein
LLPIGSYFDLKNLVGRVSQVGRVRMGVVATAS